MLASSVQQAINDQINNEFSASHAYLAMSIFCQRQNFVGCAHWLRVQAKEENGHGMRLLDFLLARDGAAALKTVPQPAGNFATIAAVFEQALEQEQHVSKQIDDLYELALKEKSFSALVELQWFINEQVEEEETAREIVGKFHLVKGDPAALLDIDRELGARTASSGTSGQHAISRHRSE
ncbi:MAG TPA: ferritin [Pirellulales bacterium]|jgi:ferritin